MKMGDNIKRDLKVMECGRWCEFFGFKVGPVAGSCENNNKPSGSVCTGNFLRGSAAISFSRRIMLKGFSSDYGTRFFNY
jgi:hypothetical protein